MKKVPFLFLLSQLSLLYVSCTPKEKAVSKAEADDIARTIKASVINKNPEFLNRFLDIDALCTKMEKVSGVRFTATDRRRFSEGIRKRKIGNEILKDFEKGSLFDLVHQYERNGKQHLVFRVYYADGGLNYYDYTLIKRAERVKAEDMLIFTSGESLSVIATRVLKDLQKKKYDLEDISGGSRIRELITGGEFEDAYEAYRQMSPVIRKQKTFMQLKIEITSSMGDDELYVKTLEEYRDLFPKDTNIPLLMIDAYFLKGEYEKVLTCVDQLDKLVQGDPFLDYYRSLCYKQMDDGSKYRSTLEKLYQYKPDFQGGNIELISVYLKQKETAKAKEIVTTYRKNLLFDQELLTEYLETANAPKDIRQIAGDYPSPLPK